MLVRRSILRRGREDIGEAEARTFVEGGRTRLGSRIFRGASTSFMSVLGRRGKGFFGEGGTLVELGVEAIELVAIGLVGGVIESLLVGDLRLLFAAAANETSLEG